MSKKKQVLLIDGDCVGFRVASACEKRSVLVKHLRSGREKEFGTRTELKKLCESKGIVFNKEDYSFTDIQTAEPEAYARSTVKKALKKIQDRFPSAEMFVVVQGEGNFRENLPLPLEYKGDREGKIRPVHLSACKDQLIKLGARLSRDCESDDVVVYKGYEYLSKGYDVIVVTNDKDSHAYYGLKVWDFTNPDNPVLEIGDLGALYEKPSGIKGNGFLWCMQQCLIGDSTDHYQPQDLTTFSLGKFVKYGEKSAYKLLKDCETKQQAWNAVLGQYKKWFPKPFTYTDWQGVVYEEFTYKDVLKLYWKCVRMKTYENDPVDLFEFLQQEGVKFEENN